MKYTWTLEQILGYIKSWSAIAHYRKDKVADPMDLIENALEKIVGKETRTEVRFKIIGIYGKPVE